jgi:UDP-glucose 4-epimerase
MKIVITGGNGYIGARLSQHLAVGGNQIIPVCFPDAPKNEEWKSKMFAIIVGDIRNDETILKITEFDPDILIHLVSLDHFDSEKEPGFVNGVNVLPTWRLLDKCTKQNLKKFIYFSTIHVYGKIENNIIEEDHAIQTNSVYGLTHYLSENICDYYNRKTPTEVIIVRLSNSYGAPIFSDNNCWWLVVNDLCKSAFLNKEIQLQSDGSPQRDFIHGNDVCQAIKRIIENDSIRIENNVYHICSGETLTIMEIAMLVKKVYQSRYNQNLPISSSHKVIIDNDVSPEVKRYKINNANIRRIGFIPLFDLHSGINDLFDYLEKNHEQIK